MSDSLKISKCDNCNATTWPIQPHCSNCFEQMQVVNASKEGKILEYSQKDENYFCMVEFDNIRLLCKLNSECPPKIGQKAKFLSHEITDQSQSFVIGLV